MMAMYGSRNYSTINIERWMDRTAQYYNQYMSAAEGMPVCARKGRHAFAVSALLAIIRSFHKQKKIDGEEFVELKEFFDFIKKDNPYDLHYFYQCTNGDREKAMIVICDLFKQNKEKTFLRGSK